MIGDIGKLRDENPRKDNSHLILSRTRTSTPEAVAKPELSFCDERNLTKSHSAFICSRHTVNVMQPVAVEELTP